MTREDPANSGQACLIPFAPFQKLAALQLKALPAASSRSSCSEFKALFALSSPRLMSWTAPQNQASSPISPPSGQLHQPTAQGRKQQRPHRKSVQRGGDTICEIRARQPLTDLGFG